MDNTIELIKKFKLRSGIQLFFGDMEHPWTILDVDFENRKFLIYSTEPVGKHKYSDGSIDWNYSDLKRWLNEEVILHLSIDEQEALVDTELGKLFILSKNENDKYQKNVDTYFFAFFYRPEENDTQLFSSYYGHNNPNPTQELNILPCAWVSMDHGFFKSRIKEKTDGIYIDINGLRVKDGVLTHILPSFKNVNLPEGIIEIDCYDPSNVEKLILPVSLKKVNGGFLNRCSDLIYLEIHAEDTIMNSKDSFWYPHQVTLDNSVFRSTVPLPATFANLIYQADDISLAWLCIHQKNKTWEKEIKKAITAEKSDIILKHMMDRMETLNYQKAVINQITKYAIDRLSELNEETVKTLISQLKAHKAEKQAAQISELLQDQSDDLSLTEKREFVPGTTIYLENNKFSWTILDVDKENNNALLIINTVQGNSFRGSLEDLNRKAYNFDFHADSIKQISSNENHQKLFILSVEQFEKYKPFIIPSNACSFASWRVPNWYVIDEDSKTFKVISPDNEYKDNPYDTQYRPNILIDLNSELIKNNLKVEEDKLYFMANPFNIAGHTLVSGNPSFTSVEVPMGVEDIADNAFKNLKELQSVTLPESLLKIGEEAFEGCSKLTDVIINSHQVSYGKNAFGSYWNSNLKFKESMFQTSGKLISQFDQKINCIEKEETIGWILLYHDDIKWYNKLSSIIEKMDKKNIFNWMVDRFNAEKKKTDKLGCAIVHYLSLYFEFLDQKAVSNFVKTVTDAKLKKTLEQISNNTQFNNWLSGNNQFRDEENSAIEILKKKNKTVAGLELLIKNYFSLIPSDLPELKYTDGNEVSDWMKSFLLCVHGLPEEKEYTSIQLFDGVQEIIDNLDVDSFNKFLETLATRYLGAVSGKKLNIAHPICRYANEALMTKLVALAPKWASSVSGNEAPPLRIFRDAAFYSNTYAAMSISERYHELGYYAKLRGYEENEYRDIYFSDIGIDKDGQKALTLGDKTVYVQLQDDLSFMIKVPGKDKLAKTLPKANVDEKTYSEANEAFKLLKKNAKKIIKAQTNALLVSFLKGDGRKAKTWQNTYLVNPLLKHIGKLVVWKQNTTLFTIGEHGLIDINGCEVQLDNSPIYLAHPMDISKEELEDWKHYFVSNNLKQPFKQLWEQVIDLKQVQENRYEGAEISAYKFSGKEIHGISSYGLTSYSDEFGFRLQDVHLDYLDKISDPYDVGSFYYELQKVQIITKSKYANHIISLLDDWTFEALIEPMIKDKDITFRGRLNTFTKEQIDSILEAANKLQEPEITAFLLQYKNEHFSTDDIFDDFTLDL